MGKFGLCLVGLQNSKFECIFFSNSFLKSIKCLIQVHGFLTFISSCIAYAYIWLALAWDIDYLELKCFARNLSLNNLKMI